MVRVHQTRKKRRQTRKLTPLGRDERRQPSKVVQRFLGGVFDHIDVITLQQTLGNLAVQQILNTLGKGTQPGVPGAQPGKPTGGGPGAGIVGQAQAHVGLIDYSQRVNNEPKGWQLLGRIFEEGSNTKFSDAELKKTWRPGGIDWCGIFCVYCWQKAGLNVTWKLGSGPQGDVKKIWPWDVGSRQVFEASIKPGDIAAIAAKAHHFIVVSTDPDAGTMQTVDGNQEYGQIKALSTRQLSDVVAYYTPK